MNFSKQMIDLVREIRRRVPSHHKPGIKLANPELLNELIPVYRDSSDTVMNTLIKELFELAGDDWPQQLRGDVDPPQQDVETADPQKVYVTKVYRGQTQLVEVDPANAKPAKPQRIYRGQVVMG